MEIAKKEQRISAADNRLEITENIGEEREKEVDTEGREQHINVADSKWEIAENIREEREVEIED